MSTHELQNEMIFHIFLQDACLQDIHAIWNETIKLSNLQRNSMTSSTAWKRSNASYLVHFFTFSLAHSLDIYMYFLQDLIATALLWRNMQKEMHGRQRFFKQKFIDSVSRYLRS